MKKRNDDIRLECVNWDEEQPATIKCKGQGHAVSRKVLTKAAHPISLVSNEIDRAALIDAVSALIASAAGEGGSK